VKAPKAPVGLGGKPWFLVASLILCRRVPFTARKVIAAQGAYVWSDRSWDRSLVPLCWVWDAPELL